MHHICTFKALIRHGGASSEFGEWDMTQSLGLWIVFHTFWWSILKKKNVSKPEFPFDIWKIIILYECSDLFCPGHGGSKAIWIRTPLTELLHWAERKIADLLPSRGNCCKLLRRPAKVLGDAQIRFVGEGDGEPFPSSSSKLKSFLIIPASPSQWKPQLDKQGWSTMWPSPFSTSHLVFFL